MGRKTGYVRKPYESARAGPYDRDGYVGIYRSMTESPAWKALTGDQVKLYIFCREQIAAKQKPGHDFPMYEAYQGNDVFYMNWKKVQFLGLYRTNKDKFYRDIAALCELGFIERLYYGKSARQKSVYRYSSKWQEYTASR
jgi:hypothetical protein